MNKLDNTIDKSKIKLLLLREIDYWLEKIKENSNSSLDTSDMDEQYRFNLNHAKALYLLIHGLYL